MRAYCLPSSANNDTVILHAQLDALGLWLQRMDKYLNGLWKTHMVEQGALVFVWVVVAVKPR